MSVFQKFVKVDDHVAEINEEPWSLYWAEHKSGNLEFDNFLKNPLPSISAKLGMDLSGYRLQTIVANHQVPMLISAVCTLIMVMPEEKTIHMTIYKHA